MLHIQVIVHHLFLLQRLTDTTTNGPSLSDYDYFGTSVTPIGDLNRDGIPDIAVGATGDDNKGAIHIMFMNTDNGVDETVEINDDTENGPSLSNTDFFGTSVASLGDLNRDGIPDIAVGAYGDNAGGTNKGTIHIMFMNTDGSVKSTVEINDDTTNGPSLSKNDNFGVSVASIGDLNRDGVQDIVVGANGDDAGGSGRGAIHIMFMNTDGSVDETVEIDDTTTNGPSLGNNDHFGTSVTSIGDLNRDGIPDIAVGAYGDNAGGTNKGAVHIMFMNTTGSVKSTVEINDDTTNGPSLNIDDRFGSSVTSIGDLDGDGVDDIIAGADGDDTGGTDKGAIHIMFMNTTGSVKSTVEINDDTTNDPFLNIGDFFGISVASIGDLDRDGIPDIAVGAYEDDTGGDNRGAIHIISLTSLFPSGNGFVDSTVEINDNTANGPSLSDGDAFGRSVASIGDLNRDGIPDIVVGAYADNAGGTDKGAIHIMFMNTTGSVKSTVEINDNTANGPSLSTYDFFGLSVASIGDLNRDGIPDIAVGAAGDSTGGSSRGAIHIMFMNTDGSVKSTVEINDNTANGPILNNTDFFGRSVASIGDLNRDGIPDIAVGATGDDAGGSGRGAIHIMFMNTTGSVKSTVEINDTTANGPSLNGDGAFGESVASIGDLNRDGIPDIAVGATGDDTGGSYKGAVHIMFMNTDGSVKSTVAINDTTANGPTLNTEDFFGTFVASLGDLNRDGIQDIVVGANGDDAGGDNKGAIHIMFMNTDGSVKSTVEINDNTANGPSLNDSDFFGRSVASLGDLNRDGIPDIAVGAIGDDAGGTNKGTTHIIFFDKTVFVTDVTSTTADNTFVTGDTIDVVIEFSEPVTVDGTPQLVLETGITDRVAAFTSGSGTDTLTFQYVVSKGDMSDDLDYVGTDSLILNGGTIVSVTSPNNVATLSLPIPGTVGSLSFNKNIVVDATNTLPTIDDIADVVYLFGTEHTIPVTVADDDKGDSLTLSMTPDLSTHGITIDSANRQIHISATTPADEYRATVTVNDTHGATATSNEFAITINTAPTIESIATGAVYLFGTEHTIPVTVADDDKGDSLTLSMTPDLSTHGITIDSANRQIHISATTPADEYRATVTVNDTHGATATSNEFAITINTAPTIESIATGAVYLFGTEHTIPVTVADDDEGDSLTLSMTPDLSTHGITIDSANRQIHISATTPADEYRATVTVNDTHGATVTSNEFSFIVNTAPTIDTIGDRLTITGAMASIPITITGDDGATDPVEYTIDITPDTDQITIDDGTITVSADTPSNIYTITVTVTDSFDVGDSDTFTLTISEQIVNVAPTIRSIGVNDMYQPGDTFTISVDAFDSNTGDTLTYTLDTDLTTDQITINSDTGIITGSVDVVGIYTITVTVTDDSDESTSDQFILRINTIPVIDAIESNNVYPHGTQFSIQVTSSDADAGDILTYNMTVTPPTLEITIDSTTGQIAGSATIPAGTYIITVTVTDSFNAVATTTFSIDVSSSTTIQNTPPVISDVNVNDAYLLGDSFTISLDASDADPNDSLTYTIHITPDTDQITIDSTTGQIAGSATIPAGTYIITVTVTDSFNAVATTTFSIDVSSTTPIQNTPPVISDVNVNDAYLLGDSFTISLDASDADPNDSLTYTIHITPDTDQITIDSTTGQITGSAIIPAGTYAITVTVTDSFNAVATTTFSIDVSSTTIQNTPPVISDVNVNDAYLLGDSFTISLDASDADPNDSLTYTIHITPDTDQITIDSTTGQITGSATIPAGTYIITVTVTDDSGASVSATLDVSVRQQVSSPAVCR